MEPILFKVIRAKCSEKGCKAIMVGGTTNHIHLLAELRSTISVSDLVQFVKGSSAYIIAHQMEPEVFFKWQGGYGVITVSPQNIPIIKKYVAAQKEHHPTGTYNHHWELNS
jgi:REP element-mobilizing transposase RayT